jgi:hypothetical protein
VTDQSHQIVPSARVLASDLGRQLRAIHDALASVEHELNQQQRGSDAIATAREHVQQAIDALELAAQE